MLLSLLSNDNNMLFYDQVFDDLIYFGIQLLVGGIIHFFKPMCCIINNFLLCKAKLSTL